MTASGWSFLNEIATQRSMVAEFIESLASPACFCSTRQRVEPGHTASRFR